MHAFFNAQPSLEGESLSLRPLEAGDLEALYLAASEPKVWAGHPVSDRYRREVFEPYALGLLSSKKALVVVDRAKRRIIGCSSYYVTADQPQSIAIGFTFMHVDYWGGAVNFELKTLMLDHAFQSFPDVWFHIAPTNVRSQNATRKLGAVHMHDAVLDFSGVSTLWMCFRLKSGTWEQVRKERSAAAALRQRVRP
jgi:RimJ/RimL family protein N-acetyltransferase